MEVIEDTDRINQNILAESSSGKLLIANDFYEHKHPYCPHGPTLLFYRLDDSGQISDGYFGCAAYRDKSKCSFHLPLDDLTSEKLSKRYEVDTEKFRLLREEFRNAGAGIGNQRSFCLDCNLPVINNDDRKAHISHEVLDNISSQQMEDPTRFLRPADDDKGQAQYFFDQKALQFFGKCFEHLRISKVICMGAPRLHAFLRTKCPTIQSYLLDFDHRFYYFYNDESFAWYNMCNNHFFDERQEHEFHKFLQCNNDEQILIFTDPPFGCRSEPVAHTLRSIAKLRNVINNLPHQPVPIFWIFPYFSEHYIREQMPEMEMSDYKVNYTNHDSYTNVGKGSRKLGSPVRLFTNVPLERIPLPVEEQYKYCAKCKRYTALENQHCHKCGVCPSKNGTTYRHCNRCGLCVKPSYVHCDSCRRCTQVEGHNCHEYQKKQLCWICRKVGHTERKCDAWQDYCKKANISIRSSGSNGKNIRCLLCGCSGHNELKCKQRQCYIDEDSFMGESQLKFRQ